MYRKKVISGDAEARARLAARPRTRQEIHLLV